MVTLALLAPFGAALAGEDCSGTPLGAPSTSAATASDQKQTSPAPAPADTSIHVHSEGGEVKTNGDATLKGNVDITQGARELKTRNAQYEADTKEFSTNEAVEYSDDQVHVKGTGAEFKTDGGGTFRSAEF